jgi:hypothetical protein
VYLENLLRLSTLLPVISYFLLKKQKNKVLRAIFIFNFVYIIFELLYYSIREYNRDASDFINIFFVPFEYFTIYRILRFSLHTDSSIKYLNYSLILLLLFWGISTIFTPFNTFNSSLNGFESLLVIILSMIFFFEEIKKPQTLFIYSQPQFWAVIGLFIFFSGSFFVFLYKETHHYQEQFKEQYLFIHSGSFILRSILFSIAMFVKPEKVNLANERSSIT